jgi:hypothetical protein
MNVRPTGPEPAPAPPAVAPAGGDVAPGSPVPAGAPAGTPPPRDGVDSAHLAEPAAFAPAEPTAAEPPGPARDAVGVQDVLRQLSGGVAGDRGVQSLNGPVKDLMLAATQNAPGALADTFKRLANSPLFRKLPPEIQAKVVALLAKGAGDQSGTQLIEKLVRSQEFARLDPKEQNRLLDRLREGKPAHEESERPADAHNRGGIQISSSGDTVPIATLIEIALMLDTGYRSAGEEANPVAVDREGGLDAGGDEDAGRSAYLEIKRVVTQLRASPTLGQPVVEEIAGVGLATAYAETGDWSARVGQPAAGPLGRVELRVPAAGQEIVSLQPRPRIALHHRDFDGDLIPASLAPEASDSADTIRFRLIDQRPAQELHFLFDRASLRLHSAEIRRTPR